MASYLIEEEGEEEGRGCLQPSHAPPGPTPMGYLPVLRTTLSRRIVAALPWHHRRSATSPLPSLHDRRRCGLLAHRPHLLNRQRANAAMTVANMYLRVSTLLLQYRYLRSVRITLAATTPQRFRRATAKNDDNRRQRV